MAGRPHEQIERVRRAFAAPQVAEERRAARFTPGKLARERAALGSLVGRLEPGWRLDIACGTGGLGETAAAGARLVGVDGSADMAAVARDVAAYRATLQADAGRLPFADGAFDSAVMIRLLHHLDQPSRRVVLTELRRVVRGHAIVSFFDAHTLEAFRARRRRRRRGSRRAIPVRALRDDAAAAGWGLEDLARKHGRLTEHVYALLC